MNSLHLVTTDARRGAETFAVNLADALTQAGDAARVVALTASGSHEAHEVLTLGSRRRALTTLHSLRKAVSGTDVVVAHGSSTLEACAIGLAGIDRPFVYRTIGDPSYWVATPKRQQWVGWMLRRASRHVVLWSGAAEQLAVRYGIPGHRIDVIPNAVPVDSFPLADDDTRARARHTLGIAAGQSCLAYIGALSPEKDVGVAIRAVAERDGAVLLIAGDGPERARLEVAARQLAPGRVCFLGTVRAPAIVYAAADLLLLPSRSEGMPGVLIEAGLVGTPCVATAVGAVPEVLAVAGTGYAVAPDDMRAFSRRVSDLLTVGPRVSARGRAGLVARFAMPSVARSWQETLLKAARS